MIDKEIKLAFKRWYEAAREIEPLLLSVIDSGLVDITPDLVAVMRVREQLEKLK